MGIFCHVLNFGASHGQMHASCEHNCCVSIWCTLHEANPTLQMK